jgi:hypothetical protein
MHNSKEDIVIRKNTKPKNNFLIFLDWLWNSDSILSYVVFLAVIFILVKFIFLPGLGLVFGTALPLAIVESSSMEHYSIQLAQNNYDLCGKTFQESKFFNAQDYWATCGDWYTQNTNITKEDFETFKLNKGFRKGDLIIIFGKKPQDIKVGDVLIFQTNRAHPLIHRVVSTSPLQTKGDHNPAQLPEEKNIQANQVIGVAVGKIPYVGWLKLFFAELFQKMSS